MSPSFQQSELHGDAYQVYVRRKQDLECVVLKYLLDYPDELLGLDRLSARYRSDSCLISLVLVQLRQWEYIALDMERNVSITYAGVDRLRRLKGWNTEH